MKRRNHAFLRQLIILTFLFPSLSWACQFHAMGGGGYPGSFFHPEGESFLAQPEKPRMGKMQGGSADSFFPREKVSPKPKAKTSDLQQDKKTEDK